MNDEDEIVAIVPAFNEAKTVARVVRVLRSCPEVSEVIVVDDGSCDGTGARAEEAGARVIALPANRGKGEALRRGVQETVAPILLFVDADLITLAPRHVAVLVGMVRSGEADMAIGVVDLKSAFVNEINRTMKAPFSGFRVLSRVIWEATNEEMREGYLIDSALNVAAKRMEARVVAVPFAGLFHVSKFSKRGPKEGALAWMKMWGEIIRRSYRFLQIFRK